MKTSYIIIIAVSVVVGVLVISVFPLVEWEASLVSPLAKVFQTKEVPSPSPIPNPKPKTFQFDSATDLKQELDSVNPQVLDSDFYE